MTGFIRCLSLFLFLLFISSSAAAQESPMTAHAVLLNSIKFEPQLFSDSDWERMTERQIINDQQAFRRTDKGHASNVETIFTSAQVKDRNPKIAAPDLMPFYKAEILKRANATPSRLAARHVLYQPKYDAARSVITFECCFGRLRAKPGSFDLLRPNMDSLSTSAKLHRTLTPKSQKLAVYTVSDNLNGKDVGRISGLSMVHGRSLPVRVDEMNLALDRVLELDGVPIGKAAAEALFNKLTVYKPITSNVVFTATGAEKAEVSAVLYGKLERVDILGPDNEVLASYKAGDFPKR